MSKTKTILNTVLGAPNSLTAIAFQTGELMERERIIKLLLDDVGIECSDKDPWSEHSDDYCNCRIIALIKEENQ